MAEVVLLVVDFDSGSRCRICHEEELESSDNLEAPCACSGTVKFAHRGCIQRWCNEKGNTTCEICLQEYGPRYTAPSKKPQLIEAAVTIRDSLEAGRSEVEEESERERLVVPAAETESLALQNHLSQCASSCRSLALIILFLRASGILLPMYLIFLTITALHNGIRRQHHMWQES